MMLPCHLVLVVGFLQAAVGGRHAHKKSLVKEVESKMDPELCHDMQRCCQGGDESCCQSGCAMKKYAFEFAGDGDIEVAKEDDMIGGVRPSGKLSAIVAAGDLAWTIIKDNAAHADVSGKRASALPKEYKDRPFMFEGWKHFSMPRFRVVEVKSLFQVTVISVDMSAHLQYNGRLSGQPGRYILNAHVAPSVSVNWPNGINATVSAAKVVNAGSTAKPCAQIDMDVRFTMGTKLKKWVDNARFRFRCDSRINFDWL